MVFSGTENFLLSVSLRCFDNREDSLALKTQGSLVNGLATFVNAALAVRPAAPAAFFMAFMAGAIL